MVAAYRLGQRGATVVGARIELGPGVEQQIDEMRPPAWRSRSRAPPWR